MYYRVYPSKNNTIFRYLTFNKLPIGTKVFDSTFDSSFDYIFDSTVSSKKSENINCGANPIMELMDGKGQSKLLFSFDLPVWLKERLLPGKFTCNLQLWDAGTLFTPAIKLKNVKLTSFENDFSEGDGYSFISPENYSGVSNWNFRDSIHTWSDTTFTDVSIKHLDRINEDLNFNVTQSLTNFLDAEIAPKFALEIDNRENDSDNIYRKFLHSSHTRTVFKPYLEFFIEDTVLDTTYSFYSEQKNRLYLVNQKGTDFTGTVTCLTKLDNEAQQYQTVLKERTGVYYVEIETGFVKILQQSLLKVLWGINGETVLKQMITVKSQNQLDSINYQDVYFYPTTSSTHNIVRQGDVIPFNVVSEIRGKSKIVLDTYEFRVLSADGFEMVPWSKVSVYRDNLYFAVNTDYFFPELPYEVFLRNNLGDSILTSNLTYKFKVAMNDKSHLREQSASPYYSREQFFSK